MNIESIKNKIIQERNLGQLSIDSRPMLLSQENNGGIPSDIINKYIQELGFHPIEGWLEVSSTSAFQIIVELLMKDLAYGITLMSDSQARDLANSLISQFSESCQFFTNRDWQLLTNDTALVSKTASWIPISDAVFDTGIVFICKQSLGIFWVTEED